MIDTTYNGWTNRATWLVQCWFEPQTVDDVDYARSVLEDAVDATPDYLRDFLCIDKINWAELRAHCEDDVEDDAA